MNTIQWLPQESFTPIIEGLPLDNYIYNNYVGSNPNFDKTVKFSLKGDILTVRLFVEEANYRGGFDSPAKYTSNQKLVFRFLPNEESVVLIRNI